MFKLMDKFTIKIFTYLDLSNDWCGLVQNMISYRPIQKNSVDPVINKLVWLIWVHIFIQHGFSRIWVSLGLLSVYISQYTPAKSSPKVFWQFSTGENSFVKWFPIPCSGLEIRGVPRGS